MKCPRCGSEMNVDGHRKYAIQMCYNCGYIEGRDGDNGKEQSNVTNFEHMKSLNFNELAVFLSNGLGVDKNKIVEWMDDIND